MAKRLGANKRRVLSERKQSARKGAARRRIVSALKWTAVAIAVGVSGFLTARYVARMPHSSDSRTIASIEVTGINALDTAAVIAAAGVVAGQRLTLTAGAIKKRIQALGWAREAAVRINHAGILEINIVEREPIAFVNVSRVSLTDRDGVLLPLPGRVFPDLPVITGLADTVTAAGRRLTGASARKLNGFFAEMRRDHAGMGKRISQIDFSDDTAVRCILAANPTVVEFRLDDVAGGLDRCSRILDCIENQHRPLPGNINLCYGNVAFVRNRNTGETRSAAD
jgi:cell division septal protein FtsQ